MDGIPYQNELWTEKYPLLAQMNLYGDDNPDDPNFPINPAYSVVKDNIWISPTKNKWNYVVDDSVKQYSEIVDDEGLPHTLRGLLAFNWDVRADEGRPARQDRLHADPVRRLRPLSRRLTKPYMTGV